MDVKDRIRRILNERSWSEYRLAIESGLSQSTVANIFNRNTSPSIVTLEAICRGFGITLAQFFSDDGSVVLTPEQQKMFNAWVILSPAQKAVLQQLILVMRDS